MQPKTMISLEQASLLLGIPVRILRQFIADEAGRNVLPVISTSGSHLRIQLDPIVNSPKEILEAYSTWRKGCSPKIWNPADHAEELERAEELRAVIRETYDADTAAIMLGVSRPTLRRWEREGKIVATRPIGPKQVRYYRESVDALLSVGAAL
ncbi:helix-turn-helix DNA binding domain protein [Gordonia phage MerCougar]|nr:helix-turn-helix DNA binding domain protein [Gordonia phage MerCougar]